MKIVKINTIKTDTTPFSIKVENAKSAEEVEKILNKAYQKRDLRPFLEALVKASNSHINYINSKSFNLLYGLLNANISNPKTNDILYLLLNDYSFPIEQLEKLTGICLASPSLSSTALLSQSTPGIVSRNIIEGNKLFILKETRLQNNKIFQAMIKDLAEGIPWKNYYSASLLLTRLSQGNNSDDFLQEAAKHKMSPSVASAFFSVTGKYTNNTIIKNSLNLNQDVGIKLLKMDLNFAYTQNEIEKVIDEIISILGHPNYDEYFDWLLNWMERKMLTDRRRLTTCFNYSPNGKNLIIMLLRESPSAIDKIITSVVAKPDIVDLVKKSDAYIEMINEGLSNPNTQSKILTLPQSAFFRVPLTDTNRKIVEESHKEKISPKPLKQDIFDINALLGDKENWFVKYAIAKEMLKEAGWKENIVTGILAAILMIFAGSTISAAAKRNNVKEQDILKAMQDQPIMEKVREIYNEQETQEEIKPMQKPQSPQTPSVKPKTGVKPKTEFDDLIQTILKHEALAKGQTPFRITNPEMKKWNTIHGFQIDKNPQVPTNRRNFIFLKNPEEVPMAVKKQFENYAYKPQQYGLPQNPTLEDAIRVFDQTGAKGKINFIQKQFPLIDLQSPLAYFLTS